MSKSRAHNTIDKGVRNNLRKLRLARGLTLEQLAARIGITWQTLQKWETDPTRLRVDRLQDIAEALGDCTPGDIVEDDAHVQQLTTAQAEALAALQAMPEDEQRQWADTLRRLAGKPANDAA